MLPSARIGIVAPTGPTIWLQEFDNKLSATWTAFETEYHDNRNEDNARVSELEEQASNHHNGLLHRVNDIDAQFLEIEERYKVTFEELSGALEVAEEDIKGLTRHREQDWLEIVALRRNAGTMLNAPCSSSGSARRQ